MIGRCCLSQQSSTQNICTRDSSCSRQLLALPWFGICEFPIDLQQSPELQIGYDGRDTPAAHVKARHHQAKQHAASIVDEVLLDHGLDIYSYVKSDTQARDAAPEP